MVHARGYLDVASCMCLWFDSKCYNMVLSSVPVVQNLVSVHIEL